MQTYSVILDANVLYSATLRDVVLHLLQTDLFKARWTDQIHDEWVEALARKGYRRDQLARVRMLVDQHVVDAKVSGYESLIPSLTLPDPKDRHVLAAAIRSNSDAIVTFNLKDFPTTELALYDVGAIHPDDFIVYQIEMSPERACAALKQLREIKTRPPLTVDDLLKKLRLSQLPETAQILEGYKNLI